MFKNLKQIKTKWFTLIEMIVVVIIIGILMYALLGNSGNADKDMELQQKMDLVSKSFDSCMNDLDEEWLNIKQAKNAMWALFGKDASTPLSTDPTATAITKFVKHPKWMGYNIDKFKQAVKAVTNADMWRTTCQDFLNNLNFNVWAKWNTEVAYIPPTTNMGGIDENYGGFLLCSTINNRKYAEFADNTRKNKFYTCAVLNLGIGSTGKKAEVLKLFGWDGKKVMKLNATTPVIEN